MFFGVSPTKTHRIEFLIMVDWSESFDSRTQRHCWRKVSMGFTQENWRLCLYWDGKKYDVNEIGWQVAALRHTLLSVDDECGDLPCVIVSIRGVKWLNYAKSAQSWEHDVFHIGWLGPKWTFHHGVFSLHLAIVLIPNYFSARPSWREKAAWGAMPEIEQPANSLDAESTTSTRTNRDLRPRINRICPMFPYDFPYDFPMKKASFLTGTQHSHWSNTAGRSCESAASSMVRCFSHEAQHF